ncbi:MAG: hypothetical protein KDD14_25735, partial [Saprospiraceae bacterium]|nr:hypothetical protein [Saprospiraceae bacterium]
VFRTEASSDGEKSQAKLGYRQADQLNLEFIIDGTGVADFGFETLTGGGTKSVPEQIEEIVNLCLRKETESHHPNFLNLKWGYLYFEGYLASLEINYTLFDAGGIPLRAKLNTSFVESIPEQKQKKIEEGNSADISRVRTVKMEDTLPLLTKEIYGNYDHLFMLARANDLDQFRKLEPGTQLIFPAIKNEKP